jgi:ADP-ribose pyrophosphatase YjhB (NUDIX family)
MDRVDKDDAPSAADLLRWAESLSGIARTGLGFTQSLYERERFEEVLKVAADIRAAAFEEAEADVLFEEWLSTVGQGVAGYVTPKVAVAAVVANEQGEILLTQRADSGWWLYPVGWADVGYSPSEIAVKEVLEETGIECEPVSLIAVLDGLRLGFAMLPMYSLVFYCRMLGGELKGHPLETSAVGFYARTLARVRIDRRTYDPSWSSTNAMIETLPFARSHASPIAR